jgi:hypothetical protein
MSPSAGDDPRAALVAVLVDDLASSSPDDRALRARAWRGCPVVGDPALELVVLVDDLLPLQGGQPAQLHVEDRVAWTSSMSSSSINPVRAHLDGRRRADERDDLVEHVERLE